jgi:hypothetical protein
MSVTNNIFLFHSAVIEGITDPSKYNLKDYYCKQFDVDENNRLKPNSDGEPTTNPSNLGKEQYWGLDDRGFHETADYLSFCPLNPNASGNFYHESHMDNIGFANSIFPAYTIPKSMSVWRRENNLVAKYTSDSEGMCNAGSADPTGVTNGSELSVVEWNYVHGANGLTVEIQGITNQRPLTAGEERPAGEEPDISAFQRLAEEEKDSVIGDFLNTSASEFEFAIVGDKYFRIEKNNENYYYSTPSSPDIAGCIARTIRDTKGYKSPAGLNRGKILDAVAIKTDLSSLTKQEYYNNNINYINQEEDGNFYLFGDKTRKEETSTFSRINVSLLFVQLKKLIGRAIRDVLFEQNDSGTRNRVSNAIDQLLRKVRADGGISEYQVICDESNNTSDVIDSNQLTVDVLVKPKKSINFIKIRFTNTENI